MSLTTSCYRHPDRATGASCTRCGRPICPDCMTEAPVGHHCPECVREGSRSVRKVRAPTGDALVVKGLIGINALLFLVQQSNQRAVFARFAMIPLAVAQGDYYRMLTAAFLHV